MAEHINERISALVDGELSKDECKRVLEELRVDPDTAASWCHYHLISDALKNKLPLSLSPDFTARLSKALEAEPPLESPLPRIRATPPFVKPAIGFALAASVAAIGYVSLGWNTQPVTNSMPSLALTASAPSTSAPSIEVAYPVSKVRGREWDIEQPSVVSKLNDYLASHGEYSAATAMQPGVLPQVRIVGYERSEVPPAFNAAERR